MTAIVRSYTSKTILKKPLAFIVENDLQQESEVMLDTIQVVEDMHIISGAMKEILSTGLSRAADAGMLETFIRSMLDRVTDLASLVTNSNAVGTIVDAAALTTSPSEEE